jgi:hypothetical protein
VHREGAGQDGGRPEARWRRGGAKAGEEASRRRVRHRTVSNSSLTVRKACTTTYAHSRHGTVPIEAAGGRCLLALSRFAGDDAARTAAACTAP